MCLASEQEPHPPCLLRTLLLRLMHLLYRSERRGRTRKTMAHWSAPASCRSSPRCDDFSLSLPVTCTMHLGTEQALRPGRNRSRPITVAWHYCCITGDSAVSLVLLRYHCVPARGRLLVLQLFRCCNVQCVRQSKHLKPSQNLQCAMQVLRAWHTQGHRALVFSQTQQMLDIVEKAVAADGAPACLPQRLPPSLDELSHGGRRRRPCQVTLLEPATADAASADSTLTKVQDELAPCFPASHLRWNPNDLMLVVGRVRVPPHGRLHAGGRAHAADGRLQRVAAYLRLPAHHQGRRHRRQPHRRQQVRPHSHLL